MLLVATKTEIKILIKINNKYIILFIFLGFEIKKNLF